MTTSILLRSPPQPSPSLSPSPASTPLPALQPDLSSSSSSSTSDSCLDLHRTSSTRSTRRIRFAPLPDPRRDLFDPSEDDLQSDTKPAPRTAPAPDDIHHVSAPFSPSVSPNTALPSARSTPTTLVSPNTSSKNSPKLNLKFLRPFSFLRRGHSSSPDKSPLFQSASLPASCNPSISSLPHPSGSVPNSPSFRSSKFPRIPTEDILTLGTKSLFRARSGSASGKYPPRTSSPPPKPSLQRSASTGSSSGMKPGNGKRDWGDGSTHSHNTATIASSGPKRRRASSSALTPGAGGGRHASSVNILPNEFPVRPSTAPSSLLAPPKKHVKMLNGRIYGAKRYAAQTLANPFANVRDEPEFVEWGYGGMGSVHASAGIANDMWKGLQRSERGGALLAGSSFGSPAASTHGATTAGGGRGSGAHATSPIARRKMTGDIPECGMGNVATGAVVEEDDGSGMGWVKRRRAEKEAKARLEQEVEELEQKVQEGRKSGDSMDVSMHASTTSTTTSLTACTSAASTDLTTPTTSPLVSRSPSATDLGLISSPSLESPDFCTASPRTVTGEQSSISDTPAHPAPATKDDYEHHILTAVRLSPIHSTTHGRNLSLSHTRSQIGKGTDDGGIEQVASLSPVDTEETITTTNSFGEEERPSRISNEGEEQGDVDDDDDEVQDIRRKTALGAGVEKISRHVDAEMR